MSEEWLTLCLENRLAEAEARSGFPVPSEWIEQEDLNRMRRDQCRANPAYVPWCVRAIVLRSTRRMIGHIGFHEPPDPPHLRAYAADAIEFGYSVFPEFRRSGYATEAVHGLMNWAAREKTVRHFVVSIAPDNAASQAIARRFGFQKVGEHMDERDGLEEIFVLAAAKLSSQ